MSTSKTMSCNRKEFHQGQRGNVFEYTLHNYKSASAIVVCSIGKVTLKSNILHITSYLIHEIIYYSYILLILQVTSNITYYFTPLANHYCGAKLSFDM